MERQDGKGSNVTDHIRVQNDLQECLESKHKTYVILSAETTYWPNIEKKLVSYVIQKPDSYEAALEAAFDVFKIPKDEKKKVFLRCRLKDFLLGTQWIYIQPAVWNEIVEVAMEFRLFGFQTHLQP